MGEGRNADNAGQNTSEIRQTITTPYNVNKTSIKTNPWCKYEFLQFLQPTFKINRSWPNKISTQIRCPTIPLACVLFN